MLKTHRILREKKSSYFGKLSVAAIRIVHNVFTFLPELVKYFVIVSYYFAIFDCLPVLDNTLCCGYLEDSREVS